MSIAGVEIWVSFLHYLDVHCLNCLNGCIVLIVDCQLSIALSGCIVLIVGVEVVALASADELLALSGCIVN